MQEPVLVRPEYRDSLGLSSECDAVMTPRPHHVHQVMSVPGVGLLASTHPGLRLAGESHFTQARNAATGERRARDGGAHRRIIALIRPCLIPDPTLLSPLCVHQLGSSLAPHK